MRIKDKQTRILYQEAVMNDEYVIKKFRRRKIVTIQFLVDILQCSVVTIRRRLKEWHAYTSINKNGAYYTLPEIPRFNQHGLWNYKSVLFSKHGTLKETVITLIKRSPIGLSAPEIRDLVGLSENSSHLSQMRTHSAIRREKYQNSYIYFSADPEIFNKQKLRFEECLRDKETVPTDAQAVALLVHFIQNPTMSSQELSEHLSKKGTYLAPSAVEHFLSHHDLLKKTADTEQ